MAGRYNSTNDAIAGPAVHARAPAKINWVLDLLDRRSDGFHELETVASVLGLSDELHFEGCSGAEGVRLTCNDGSLPTDARNLVVRAAMLLSRRGARSPQASIHLEKHIPAGGGLGGGSSDAAVTLRVLNTLWKLNWTTQRLVPLAAELGSDVPILLHGGTVVSRGRGEFVQPLAFEWPGFVVIAMPGLHVPTKSVYGSVQPGDLRGKATAEDDFRDGSDPSRWTAAEFLGRCRNGLEAAAFRCFPALRDCQDVLCRTAGRQWRLCGSGSSFFTLFDTADEAQACARDLMHGVHVNARVTKIGTEVS